MRLYQIALSLLPGIGPVKAKNLLKKVGGLEAFFSESEKSLLKLEGVNPQIIKNLNRDEALIRAEEELKFIEKNAIDLYYYEDSRYPSKLRNCEDGPIVIFTKGNVTFDKKQISIVGTRKVTSYGKKMTRKLIEDLSEMNVTIVSGLAHGVDYEAHRAALDFGLSTIGVLGHGLDTMYPAAHRSIAREMLESGGLLTEFLSNAIGDPANFPKRNRIVAGLSEATVVIESAESGGSLITANLANDYNRDVFAFPGNVDRESSKGCNNLIRRDKAHLITCAEEMVEILGWELRDKANGLQTDIFIELTDEEEKIVGVFKNKGEIDIDNLSYETSMPSSTLSLHLFNLEMKGQIRSMPGKRYALNS